MIAEIKTLNKFTPFKLELTIETEEELCDLWHRLNIGSDKLNGESKYDSANNLKHPIVGNKFFAAFIMINNEVKKLNLKNK